MTDTAQVVELHGTRATRARTLKRDAGYIGQEVAMDPAPWHVQASFAHNSAQFFSIGGRRARHRVTTPPFDYRKLLHTIMRSGSLSRSIRVLSDRIGQYGVEVVPRWKDADPEKLDPAQRDEVELVLAASGWECGGYRQLRKKKDLEFYSIGNGAKRVVRDRAGRIAAIEPLKALGVRVALPWEDGDDEVEVMIPLFLPSTQRTVWLPRPTKFKRFMVYEGNRTYRWYKQLGDPRPMHAATGETRPAGARDFGDDEAQELMWFTDTWPGIDHYGCPGWYAQRDEATAEANLGALLNRWSNDGLLDTTLLLTSNGGWDPTFVAELERHLRDHSRGWAKAFNVILGSAIAGAEASEGVESKIIDGDEAGSPGSNRITAHDLSSKLDLEKIVDNMVKLASFNRSYAFGLPPGAIGVVEEDSRATAEAVLLQAETGVYMPARQRDDEFSNLYLLPQMGVVDWVLRTRNANTNEAARAAEAAAPFIDGGALSINGMIDWANKISGLEFAQSDDPLADVPLALIGAVAGGAMTPEEANADEQGAMRSAELVRRFKKRVVAMHRQLASTAEAAEIVDDVKREAERAGQQLPDNA